jgi:hypothetical protein
VKVGLARATAARWVARHARDDAGFRGAFFSGSTTWQPDDGFGRPAIMSKNPAIVPHNAKATAASDPIV